MAVLFALLFAKWDVEEDFQHIRIKIQLQRDMCHNHRGITSVCRRRLGRSEFIYYCGDIPEVRIILMFHLIFQLENPTKKVFCKIKNCNFPLTLIEG